jgi:hypothetical protein
MLAARSGVLGNGLYIRRRARAGPAEEERDWTPRAGMKGVLTCGDARPGTRKVARSNLDLAVPAPADDKEQHTTDSGSSPVGGDRDAPVAANDRDVRVAHRAAGLWGEVDGNCRTPSVGSEHGDRWGRESAG